MDTKPLGAFTASMMEMLERIGTQLPDDAIVGEIAIACEITFPARLEADETRSVVTTMSSDTRIWAHRGLLAGAIRALDELERRTNEEGTP